MKNEKKRIQELENELYECRKKHNQYQEKVFVAFMFILGIVGAAMMAPIVVFGANVNERAFCQTKLDNYYPELSPVVIKHMDMGGDQQYCETKISIGGDQRDGLLLNIEPNTQKFYLTEQADREYLAHDDPYWLLFIIGAILFCLSLAVMTQNMF